MAETSRQFVGVNVFPYVNGENLWAETHEMPRPAEKSHPPINLKLDVNLTAKDVLEEKLLEGIRQEFEDRLPEMIDRAIERGVRKMEFDRAKVTSHIITD